MDVHHPNHPTHKKKWTEYLLEFFMLFLAVFLGFVAENIREDSSNKHKENGYIRSLIKDLKTDTGKIAANLNQYQPQLDSLKSLGVAFESIDSGYTNRLFTLFVLANTGFPEFIYTDPTIQQLKNSGGFSLIENKDAIDSILAYDAEVKKALRKEAVLGKENRTLTEVSEELINWKAITRELNKAFKERKAVAGTPRLNDFTVPKFDFLLTHNASIENRYFNKLSNYINTASHIRNENYKPLHAQATRLITFLKKEYHLKDE